MTLIFSGKVIQEFELDTILVIGRDPGADITIDNLGVSRRHAEVRRDGEYTTITDLDSNNGTYVNGKQIQKHPLKITGVIELVICIATIVLTKVGAHNSPSSIKVWYKNQE